MKKKIKIKKISHDHENGRFQTQQSSSPALKLKRNRGEIGERKDRHSKVCTAKGPRDRRVRLSAHTAIQFYDFQDRLGCGRPSEAIDWLMKEAKAAIDALHELPITTAAAAATTTVPSADQKTEQGLEEDGLNHNHEIDSHQHFNQDSIDGLRSQSHGFCLSLQFCQNPNWPNPQTLFSASASLDFEATPTNWSNPETLEIGQSQRVITWTSNSSSGNGEGREGFVVNSAAQTGLGLNQFLSQGGTLQSSYPPSIPDSMNPQLSNLNYDQSCALGPFSGTGNSIIGDEFSFSPRIQEEEEKQNAVPNKPSSASATCLLHYQD